MIALAVQMIVSFGHMHRDDLGLPPLAASDGTEFTSNAVHMPAHPADGHDHPASNDYCPICASMALVATALSSLPPVLVVPEPIHHIRLPETLVNWPSAQVARSFQARAPPHG